MAEQGDPAREPGDVSESMLVSIQLASIHRTLGDLPDRIAEAMGRRPGGQDRTGDQEKGHEPPGVTRWRQEMGEESRDRQGEQMGAIRNLLSSLTPLSSGFGKLAAAFGQAQEIADAIEGIQRAFRGKREEVEEPPGVRPPARRQESEEATQIPGLSRERPVPVPPTEGRRGTPGTRRTRRGPSRPDRTAPSVNTSPQSRRREVLPTAVSEERQRPLTALPVIPGEERRRPLRIPVARREATGAPDRTRPPPNATVTGRPRQQSPPLPPSAAAATLLPGPPGIPSVVTGGSQGNVGPASTDDLLESLREVVEALDRLRDQMGRSGEHGHPGPGERAKRKDRSSAGGSQDVYALMGQLSKVMNPGSRPGGGTEDMTRKIGDAIKLAETIAAFL